MVERDQQLHGIVNCTQNGTAIFQIRCLFDCKVVVIFEKNTLQNTNDNIPGHNVLSSQQIALDLLHAYIT